MLAHQLKAAASAYFVKKRMAVTFELGLCRGGRLRADLVAVSMGGKVVIVETKSSVRDFRTDSKWEQYLEFADTFYFAFDRPTYLKLKAEIPKGVGILVIDEVLNKRGTRTILKAKVVQRAKALELDEAVRRELFIRMVFRTSDLNRYKRK